MRLRLGLEGCWRMASGWVRAGARTQLDVVRQAGRGLIRATVETWRCNFGNLGKSRYLRVRMASSRPMTMASQQPAPGPASMRTMFPAAIDFQFCGNPD